MEKILAWCDRICLVLTRSGNISNLDFVDNR